MTVFINCFGRKLLKTALIETGIENNFSSCISDVGIENKYATAEQKMSKYFYK